MLLIWSVVYGVLMLNNIAYDMMLLMPNWFIMSYQLSSVEETRSQTGSLGERPTAKAATANARCVMQNYVRLDMCMIQLCSHLPWYYCYHTCAMCVLHRPAVRFGKNQLQRGALETVVLLYCINSQCHDVLQSNHYTTISDAISKLNFHQALHDENCFPFICKVC